ncbi:MAG TPA: hypothetical protein VNF46_03610 [Gammaproteobacteria bacterium]|nr:hypothetical protein [Gammaproteobacteria bacterium]
MKLTTALVAGALLALSGTSLVYAQQAPAPAATPQQQETRHIRKDTRDIHHDRRDVRHDQRQINRDVAQGKFRKARAQVKDMRKDKRDIHHDKKNRRHVRRARKVQNQSGPGGI